MIIHEIALAMARGLPLQDLAAAVPIDPSYGSVLRQLAVQAQAGKLEKGYIQAAFKLFYGFMPRAAPGIGSSAPGGKRRCLTDATTGMITGTRGQDASVILRRRCGPEPHADRERRTGRGLRRRVFLELRQDRPRWPGRAAGPCPRPRRRVLLDVDVGRNAHVLDDPAVLGEDRQVGRGHDAAVHQDGEAEDADQPAPGPLADQLAEAELAEHPGQQVAAGARRSRR